jgi:hypothetical protein
LTNPIPLTSRIEEFKKLGDAMQDGYDWMEAKNSLQESGENTSTEDLKSRIFIGTKDILTP